MNVEGIWVKCGCQFNATAKWRYDQIQIYPESLKFKKWEDFNGMISPNSRLQTNSLISEKGKALAYCFGKPDPELAKNRTKNSVVLSHIRDGQNMIISGPNGSGRSLLATLILKEILFASAIKQTSVDFHWIRAEELTEAARWSTSVAGSTGKPIDRESLDNWAEAEFLFIDGLEPRAVAGDHRWPPDITSINLLFSNRLLHKLPTIIVCSDSFLHHSRVEGHSVKIKEQWGDGLLSLMKDSKAVVIELAKAGKIG